jgi:transposase
MNKKPPDEFKQEAVRQVVEKDHSVPDVAKQS